MDAIKEIFELLIKFVETQPLPIFVGCLFGMALVGGVVRLLLPWRLKGQEIEMKLLSAQASHADTLAKGMDRQAKELERLQVENDALKGKLSAPSAPLNVRDDAVEKIAPQLLALDKKVSDLARVVALEIKQSVESDIKHAVNNASSTLIKILSDEMKRQFALVAEKSK